jgi:heme O synthase-like polyprenyltransferase
MSPGSVRGLIPGVGIAFGIVIGEAEGVFPVLIGWSTHAIVRVARNPGAMIMFCTTIYHNQLPLR